jgi:hypothetical protein
MTEAAIAVGELPGDAGRVAAGEVVRPEIVATGAALLLRLFHLQE